MNNSAWNKGANSLVRLPRSVRVGRSRSAGCGRKVDMHVLKLVMETNEFGLYALDAAIAGRPQTSCSSGGIG